MRIPLFIDILFNPEMDKPINSVLSRAINRAVKIEYDRETDSFTSALMENWCIGVSDGHNTEWAKNEPHYKYWRGEGNWKKHTEIVYKVRYCDQLSEDDGRITENPGWWEIHIWLPDNFKHMAPGIAKAINDAYVSIMRECLPEYDILSAEPVRVK